ncbi:hypothetical protein AVEN_29977-1 [Araneus ventricosus]|uniref:Prokineticin domain-containing protein n=1 Tax=Araneus ventricosus TaxID=182803 RepID=A0A4Y2RT56_ARAVE|nr:hypothetical protein AVEN_29977-1 [Araneus ventricosus]
MHDANSYDTRTDDFQHFRNQRTLTRLLTRETGHARPTTVSRVTAALPTHQGSIKERPHDSLDAEVGFLLATTGFGPTPPKEVPSYAVSCRTQPERCGKDECCLEFGMFGICAPLMGEGEECDPKEQEYNYWYPTLCPCADGLVCEENDSEEVDSGAVQVSRFVSGHLRSCSFSHGNKVFPVCAKCGVASASPEHILSCLRLSRETFETDPLLALDFLRVSGLMDGV